MFRLSSLRTRVCLRSLRYNSTASTASTASTPLLTQMRADMKAAMKAKEKTKLNVIRSIISEINNSKAPFQTDIQILSLIRKRTTSLDEAAREYAQAGRDDLIQNATEEKTVLNEYANQVALIGEDEIETAVSKVIQNLQKSGTKPQIGPIFKALFSPDGALHGKPVEKKTVDQVIRKLIAS